MLIVRIPAVYLWLLQNVVFILVSNFKYLIIGFVAMGPGVSPDSREDLIGGFGSAGSGRSFLIAYAGSFPLLECGALDLARKISFGTASVHRFP